MSTSSSATTTVPDFIQPSDLRSYTDEQIDAMIANIRAQRMSKFYMYQKATEAKDKAKDAKIAAQLEKELQKTQKLFDQLDKKLEEIQVSVNKTRAWRLQLGEIGV